MQIRDMSIRAFALHCDISKSQMSNVLNKTQSPGLLFLEKLAQGTNTPISDLVKLIFPEPDSVPPEISILSRRIAALPPDDKRIVESLVLGLALKRKQQALQSEDVDRADNIEED